METLNKYFRNLLDGITFLGSFQCNLLYYCNYPEGSKEYVSKPTEYGIPYKDLRLITSDNVKIHVYDIQYGDNAKAKTRPTILYFHGNSGNMGHCLEVIESFYKSLHCNTVMVSYRGYGFSEGYPNEKGLKIDAQTGLDYIKSHDIYKNTKVIVFGQSLGGAVSINLVSRNEDKVDGLIVENTFLSIPKLLPHVMPSLKHLSILCTQKWESEKYILNIKQHIPILFLAGELDELIPKEHVCQLFDLATANVDNDTGVERRNIGKRKIKLFPDGYHTDTFLQPNYYESIREFILFNVLHDD